MVRGAWSLPLVLRILNRPLRIVKNLRILNRQAGFWERAVRRAGDCIPGWRRLAQERRNWQRATRLHSESHSPLEKELCTGCLSGARSGDWDRGMQVDRCRSAQRPVSVPQRPRWAVKVSKRDLSATDSRCYPRSLFGSVVGACLPAVSLAGHNGERERSSELTKRCLERRNRSPHTTHGALLENSSVQRVQRAWKNLLQIRA